MKKEIVFFLPEGSINDATEYYLNILCLGLKDSDFNVVYCSTLKGVHAPDYILTIEAKQFFLAKIKFPKAKIINWFQGVVAEEAYMLTKSIARKYVWHFYEWFTLKFSFFNIVVSKKMLEYFEKKYKVSIGKNSFIMPCFNKKYDKGIWSRKKISDATFVYAGSLAAWQCVDKMLKIYSHIEKNLENTKITLLTKDCDKAVELINQYDLKNYDVRYVPLAELENELIQYKYGFLIREDHIVNQVATPTKMNSYLAAGIIPIYSNVVDDFNKNLSNYTTLVRHENQIPESFVTDQILSIERIGEDDFSLKFKKDLDEIFKNYYNEEVYLTEFKSFLKERLINF
ncbi:hypothetical protein F971_03343 [Acinetobacter vivianii]|uniref:Glycosyl transferase family 1 domain-containing protein n=1 Tax=Acinetobacter vivianii TaxID=1776742 RepID=N8UUX9_9GAMM|nr:hypothetical protein [Acinetobacter vivianii]ENU91205.1 hypothetical protein F971_03343 [Acinetobacter vivianii]